MEKLLRVKASQFKGEELNLITLEESIDSKYANVAYSDIKVENDLIDTNFTLLIDKDIEVVDAERIILDKLSNFFDGIKQNAQFFSTYEGWSMMKFELNNRISDMEEVLLSE